MNELKSMKERKCLICGRAYVKVIGVSFAKYCSEECRRKAAKEQSKARHKLNYKSQRKQGKCAICKSCGKKFYKVQQKQTFCCVKCREKYRYKQGKGKIHQYKCEWCGKTFYGGVKRNKNYYRFCSRKCSAKHIAQVKKDRSKPYKYIGTSMVWKINKCKTCGKIFLDTSKHLYCCAECSKEMCRRRSEQKREAIYKNQRKHCRNCGIVFIPTVKKSKVFCSEECREEYKRRYSHAVGKRRLRGKIIDRDITLDRLIARDNGRCGLCGGVVDKNDYTIKDGAFITGALYPSIDHIKPLSKGGLHSWDNVQLAHFVCNARKGARGA